MSCRGRIRTYNLKVMGLANVHCSSLLCSITSLHSTPSYRNNVRPPSRQVWAMHSSTHNFLPVPKDSIGRDWLLAAFTYHSDLVKELAVLSNRICSLRLLAHPSSLILRFHGINCTYTGYWLPFVHFASTTDAVVRVIAHWAVYCPVETFGLSFTAIWFCAPHLVLITHSLSPERPSPNHPMRNQQRIRHCNHTLFMQTLATLIRRSSQGCYRVVIIGLEPITDFFGITMPTSNRNPGGLDRGTLRR